MMMENTSIRPVKKYWCSTCNRSEWHNATPIGWYAFSQSRLEGWGKLGLYCSLACLLERVSTMNAEPVPSKQLCRDN
jgi:hypothetical protein